MALFGTTVVPFEIAEVISGNTSAGHAQLCNKPIPLKTASDYVKTLEAHQVMVDVQTRRKEIEKQLSAIEHDTQTTAIEKDKVLPQVLYLAEWPMLTYAYFDEAFLKRPKKCSPLKWWSTKSTSLLSMPQDTLAPPLCHYSR